MHVVGAFSALGGQDMEMVGHHQNDDEPIRLSICVIWG